jgi:tetratricopeptide (TPR) repeat protein
VAVAGAAGAAVWALSFQQTSAAGTHPASSSAAPNAAALLQSGVQQIQSRDLDGAEATFRQVLRVDRGNKIAWYDIGVAAAQEGRPDDAVEAYSAALKIDPSYTSALFNKALLLKSRDPEQTIALLKRTVAINPRASTAYYQLGDTLMKKSRDSQARDAFRHAVTIDPALESQVPKKFRAG